MKQEKKDFNDGKDEKKINKLYLKLFKILRGIIQNKNKKAKNIFEKQ